MIERAGQEISRAGREMEGGSSRRRRAA
jgi:hypothetical protein